MTLRIVAHLTSKADKVEETKALCTGLLAPTRKEAGCISYILLQNNEDPSEFTFVEEWDNDAALDAHLASPHVASAFEKVPALLTRAPEIHRYTLVG